MLQGGCHCGKIRYAMPAQPARHGLCHCADCRVSAGAPVVSWVVARADQVKISGKTGTYASSEHGRREFCPECGTSLFYRNAVAMPGLIDVASATLDDPDAIQPKEQIQVAERIGWMKTAHSLPEFDRFPPDLG